LQQAILLSDDAMLIYVVMKTNFLHKGAMFTEDNAENLVCLIMPRITVTLFPPLPLRAPAVLT
jgi:hypothetical protein